MFSWYHLLIIILPILGVIWASWRCRRYIRSVTDFLVAGRCAGRYVLLSGGMMGGLSVVMVDGQVSLSDKAVFAAKEAGGIAAR